MKRKFVAFAAIFSVILALFGCKMSDSSAEISQTSAIISAETTVLTSEVATQFITELPPLISSDKGGNSAFTFRSTELFQQHFNKHKAEFGKISQEDYLKKAQDLIEASGENILTKFEKDGDKLIFNTENDEFLVLSEDGFIRTFFKPEDLIDYFNRQ
ncbi:MAG: hypothetical protein RR540_02195 [Oscillospiraceae bacterium]